MSEPEFDPLLALRTLVAHEVRFVVIGGYAGSLLGSPVVTGDLDICYARDRKNLERLADALHELQARLRGPRVPEEVPFQVDARSLEMGDHFTFSTRGGALDILGTPSGTRGFEDLDGGAETFEVDGVRVRVASVDDLIRMKRASGRPKDRQHELWLRALRQEIERPEGEE
ncbi:MAG: hypothetical protein HY658_05060 [Actinobacteria bacterium]|nr:hypothetical protein [Actinomycetota bacterium]